MNYKLSSISNLSINQSIIRSTTKAAIFNTTQKTLFIRKQSKIQRWILGMMIGSAPFLVILLCWMFVSVCINNLVRYCQQRKNRYRSATRINEIRNNVSKVNV